MYTILIIGSGGREHALSWKIAQSPKCKKLFVAPGNGGTAGIAENVVLDILDFDVIKSFIKENGVQILVVGPELPLVAGIYDALKDIPDLKIIGPSKEASELEGSKAFANAFMEEFNIPTASSTNITLDNIQEANDIISKTKGPYVLKADGLAAGKGVLIISNPETAKEELSNMLNGKFGEASSTVVLEQFLDGIEFSVFALTDGSDYVLLPEAKDYKRIGENDTGLNTGGMGAISPVPFVDDQMMKKVKERIIDPTINGLKSRNFDYKGFIFFGLINVANDPYVIEYNCRLGDPETEVIIPRIENDIVDLFEAVYDGNLNNIEMNFSNQTASTIMMVSGGYPEAYEKKKEIQIETSDLDCLLFHSGTKQSDGVLQTSGGRVIAVTSLADSHQEGVQKSLAACEKIQFEKKYYRTDIGFDL